MKRVWTVAVASALAVLAQPHPSVNAAPIVSSETAGTVKITVHYKGKGKVDASHKLWVWVFDSPNIGAGSMPLGQVALDRNDTEAVFEGIAGNAFIAAAFDESGAMTGDAPPPPGTPIGLLMGADGKPAAVTPDSTTRIALVFDDSQRMP